MKSFKTLVAAAMLLFCGSSAMAQATYEDADGTKYEFKKHAFLQLQGGAQYTLGEAKFKDLISPNVQLALGYQFSPVFAARIQANAWQSKGGWNGYTTSANVAPLTADYKYKYVAPGLDLMFNLSNLFCGWNPNRVFNVTAFLGGGANIGWDNDEVNDIASTMWNLGAYELEYLWDGTKIRPFGRAGLAFDFRLSDAVSLGIEGNANILSDKYNSKKADNPDWYFNALVGLKINLGKTYTKVVPPAPEPIPEPAPEPAKVVEEKPAPVVVKKEPVTLTRNVFFVINSSKVSETEEVKVKEVADFLKANPNTKVQITGYADAGTGNDKINDRLAAQRADIVVKELTENYGIPMSRISSDSKGARVQPFEENDLNRVAICIVAE